MTSVSTVCSFCDFCVEGDDVDEDGADEFSEMSLIMDENIVRHAEMSLIMDENIKNIAADISAVEVATATLRSIYQPSHP